MRPRLFVLQWNIDIPGAASRAEITEGVVWSDGGIALRVTGTWPTTTVWDHGLDALFAVHGDRCRTTFEWLDAHARQKEEQ